MLKILKWSALVVGVLIGALIILGMIFHQPLPVGKAGPEAEALAKKMQKAINQAAWDSTRYVSWDFAGIHRYLWDKEQHLVEVSWGEHRVILNTQTQQGKAWKAAKAVDEQAAKKMIGRAWSFFCNDSFWLNAPAKAFDPGTERLLVELADGSKGLLVRYNSGGVTPGDNYLWMLDETGRPKSWKMWVKILPIGGAAVSWENWQTLSTGAEVATLHASPLFDLKIKELAGGMTLEEIGLTKDPFAGWH